MTQDAVVCRCFPDGMAEVAVTRAAACGSGCASCEACVFQNELRTRARNLIGAKPGQRVLIESSSPKVFRMILLVYVLPVVLAVAGYFLAYAAGAAEGLRILCTFLGFLLGGAVLVLSQRAGGKERPIEFDIIDFK